MMNLTIFSHLFVTEQLWQVRKGIRGYLMDVHPVLCRNRNICIRAIVNNSILDSPQMDLGKTQQHNNDTELKEVQKQLIPAYFKSN